MKQIIEKIKENYSVILAVLWGMCLMIVFAIFWLYQYKIEALKIELLSANANLEQVEEKLNVAKEKSVTELTKERYDELVQERIIDKKKVEVLKNMLNELEVKTEEITEPKIRCERENLLNNSEIDCNEKYEDFL